MRKIDAASPPSPGPCVAPAAALSGRRQPPDTSPGATAERKARGGYATSARAKARGVKLGRPKVSAKVEAAIKKHLAAGTGILKTARTVGVGSGTVQRIKAEPATRAS